MEAISLNSNSNLFDLKYPKKADLIRIAIIGDENGEFFSLMEKVSCKGLEQYFYIPL